MKEKIINNKKIILPIILVLLLVIVAGVSYAFWQTNLQGVKEITFNTGGIDFTYLEQNQGISLTNSDPISDAVGKTSTAYFDFTVSLKTGNSTTVNYIIYITKDNSSTLEDEYVKLYLTNQSNSQIVAPSLISNLDIYFPATKSYVLYEKSISSNNNVRTTDYYRLRAWIDSSYDSSATITNGAEGQSIGQEIKTYKFKVNVTTIENEVPATDDACFVYTTDSTSATITGYKCYAGNTFGMPTITDLVIPNKLGGKTVELIADGTSSSPIFSGLTSVVLPNTLKIIGAYAFLGNNLTGTLTIPASVVTIGNFAFRGEANGSTNKITTLIFEVGSKLETIGQYAFRDNKLTGALTIPSTVTSIGSRSFEGASNGSTNQLTTLVFAGGSSPLTLWDFAFANNKLSGTLTIPTNVILIKSAAFMGATDGTTNQLTSLVFTNGSQLGSIETGAFKDNKLTGILTIPASVTKIDSSAFFGNSNGSTNQLTSVVFASGSQLVSIGSEAFRGNKLSGTLTIPTNVNFIGNFAFAGEANGTTNKITTLIFTGGSSPLTLLDSAFAHNKLSGTLTIPANMTKIDQQVFLGNDNGTTNQLTSVVFTGGSVPLTLGNSSFAHNKLSGTLKISANVTVIDSGAFGGKLDGTTNQITTLLIMSGNLTTINGGAFSNNNITGAVTIPSTVTTIGANAFYKSTYSNSNLYQIVNTTGNSFNWGEIINGSSGYNFAIGTVINPTGNVVISAS